MTPWAVVHQAPVPMGFPRQEYWSGLPALLQEIFQTQGSNTSLSSPAFIGGFFTASATWEAPSAGLFRFPTRARIHSPLKNGRMSIYTFVCVPFPGVDICRFVLYKVQISQSPGGGAKRRISFKLRSGQRS